MFARKNVTSFLYHYLFIFLAISNVILFAFFFTTQTYPFAFLSLHVVSLVFLWAWVLYPRSMSFKKTYRDILIVLLLFFIAFFIRIYKIDTVTPGMWGDEISVAIAGEKALALHSFLPYIPQYIGHPTPLLYLVGLSIHFLGKTMLAIRLQSVVFAALSIPLFYIFLCHFFRKTIAFFSSLIFCFSYSHLILSRFAYDITAAIFFQILLAVFLYRAWRYRNVRSYVGVALSIGFGLFTYYSFRSYAATFTLLTLFLIAKEKQRGKKMVIFLSTLFISVILLLSFDLRDMNHFLARTKAISVFNQGFTGDRVLKELLGNIRNDIGALFFVGDPTPRQNPSATSFFDFVTTCMYFIGAGTLFFKKKKPLLFVSLVMVLCALLDDVFTVEIFPEFHFYGTGHPSLLRLSGILPVVYFWFSYALEYGSQKIQKKAYIPVLIVFTTIILLLNWAFYFGQPKSPYNYKYNGQRMIKLVQMVNASKQGSFYASPSIVQDERFAYFVSNKKRVYPLTFSSVQNGITQMEKHTITLVDPEVNTLLVQALVLEVAKNNTPLRQRFMLNPWGGVDAVIITQ